MSRQKSSRLQASLLSRGERKPIRPVERQKMRPWLTEILNQGNVPGLRWEDKSALIFRIAWRHAARHGWNVKKDAGVFERWAVHTGKYVVGDQINPKKWKANFRCALHSLLDVVELKDMSIRKGCNAFRCYQFLEEQKTGKRSKRHVMNTNTPPSTTSLDTVTDCDACSEDGLSTEDKENMITEDDSGIGSDSEMSDSRSPPRSFVGDHDYISTLPNFNRICSSTKESKKQATNLVYTHLSPHWDFRDDDEISNTSGKLITDDQIVDEVVDMMMEPASCDEAQQYDPSLWNTPIHCEIDDEPVYTLFILGNANSMPAVITQQAPDVLSDWNITGLEKN